MADTCGDCMLLDTQYNCGWCNESDSCAVHNGCPYGARSWLNNMHSCSNVEVYSVRNSTRVWALNIFGCLGYLELCP